MAKETTSVTVNGLDENILHGYQMNFDTRGLAPVTLDAPEGLGDGEGYAPLELLLSSLGACAAMTVASSLRIKAKRKFGGVTVKLLGTLRERAPVTFSHIDMAFEFFSTDATEDEIKHAIDMAESRLCPVWALVKGNVEVDTTFSINA